MTHTPHLDLIEKAIIKHGPKIYPCKKRCGKNIRWDKSFTEVNGNLLFWYNTPDRDTHMEKVKIS